MDDIPIGQKAKKIVDEYEENAPSQQKQEDGPLHERLVSKAWATRAAACEELRKEFKKCTEQNDPIFKEYGHMMAKIIADSHPGAQEKALEVLDVFINYSQYAGQYIEELIKVLCEKGLTASKPSNKQKASDCILQLLEVTEKFEDVLNYLLELINSKNLKVIFFLKATEFYSGNSDDNCDPRIIWAFKAKHESCIAGDGATSSIYKRSNQS